MRFYVALVHESPPKVLSAMRSLDRVALIEQIVASSLCSGFTQRFLMDGLVSVCSRCELAWPRRF